MTFTIKGWKPWDIEKQSSSLTSLLGFDATEKSTKIVSKKSAETNDLRLSRKNVEGRLNRKVSVLLKNKSEAGKHFNKSQNLWQRPLIQKVNKH